MGRDNKGMVAFIQVPLALALATAPGMKIAVTVVAVGILILMLMLGVVREIMAEGEVTVVLREDWLRAEPTRETPRRRIEEECILFISVFRVEFGE